MKRRALSLKVWIGIILVFIVFQYLSRLYFEEKIFFPREEPSLSDGHFIRMERDFQNTTTGIPKVVVIGSSRVAKGIECPDEIRNTLIEKGKPSIQLNKIWESFDPFESFVKHKKFLQRLIPIQPDLVCIQTDMIAIQMPISVNKKNMEIEQKFKKIWDLEYKGNKEKYLSKKLKYQSKVNQEFAYTTINAKTLFQGKGPCTINDIYSKMDTIKQQNQKRDVKKVEDIQYTFEDLKRLQNAGIKVVIIDVPFPNKKQESIHTPAFIKDLQHIKKEYKNRFDIDYWDYTGQTLYYKHFADEGHLNPEGRSIYTDWLLDKIQKEIPIR